jgi:hypothetical protein
MADVQDDVREELLWDLRALVTGKGGLGAAHLA